MDGFFVCGEFHLHFAGGAFGESEIGGALAERIEHRPAGLEGEVKIFLLETEGAGDAAAAIGEGLDFDAFDGGKQSLGCVFDLEGLEVTGSVVGEGCGERFEIPL